MPYAKSELTIESRPAEPRPKPLPRAQRRGAPLGTLALCCLLRRFELVGRSPSSLAVDRIGSAGIRWRHGVGAIVGDALLGRIHSRFSCGIDVALVGTPRLDTDSVDNLEVEPPFLCWIAFSVAQGVIQAHRKRNESGLCP